MYMSDYLRPLLNVKKERQINTKMKLNINQSSNK